MVRGGRISLSVMVLALLFSGFAAAQDALPRQGHPYTITAFTLRDVAAKQNISDVPIMFSAHNLNTGEDERITQYVDASSMFSYRLTPGNWIIEFRIFNVSTDSFLYYSKNVINVQPTDYYLNKTFYLTPVGSIDGSVVGPDGEPVQGAELDFVCAASLRYDDLPSTTNSLGSFHADIVPVGVCKVYSTTGELVGSADISVRQGERMNMTLRLAKKDTRGERVSGWIVSLFAIIFIGLVIAVYILKIRVKKEIRDQLRKINAPTNGAGHDIDSPTPSNRTTATSSDRVSFDHQPLLGTVTKPSAGVDGRVPQGVSDIQTSASMNPRARDILKTLSERESAIAVFLLDSGYEMTQAKIRNTLGIPKTSLARLLRTLEEKKVLHVDHIGNMKRIKLTDWFLGKD